MMTRLFLLLLFLFSSRYAFSQTFKNDSVKSFVDKSIELISGNSIHKEKLEVGGTCLSEINPENP